MTHPPATRKSALWHRPAVTAVMAAAAFSAAACGAPSSPTAQPHGAGAARSSASGSGQAQAQTPAVGTVAPSGSFTTTSGKTVSMSALRGYPALVWFVATWCSSCQAGTQAMAASIGKLRADGVQVVELELYQDLGQPGPGIAAFEDNAGAAARSPGWVWGTASLQLSKAYDPAAYLDIYYLLGPDGRIRYINSSPAATMTQLLGAARHLT